MKVQITVGGERVVANALTYAFPKSPKTPENFVLFDEHGTSLGVACTGGGKYPTYVYFLLDGKSWYLPKNVTPDSNTAIRVIPEEAKPAKAEAPAAEAAAEAPAAEAEVVDAKPKKAPRTAKK